ncbi:MAG: M48 family metalloprotease [Acidobacteriota bacterium]|nr:MAG: M48 family metalloprotease [Acidobacteriota bacterium]
MGERASGDVEASMGLYDDAELQAYVGELGQHVAAASERPHLPWRFKVIDSPVVNAFALPGGYVYVTRGILAYVGSEAALMGVIGHEIGHVTARHHVEQQLAGLGLNVGTIFSEVRPFGDVLGGGLGILLLKFGRDAERESDRLGARYSIAQGYDATDMAHFFSVLGRLSGSEQNVPSWASTHPDPADREATILALVAEHAGRHSDLESRRSEYLSEIEGLVFGENPREGFMRGRRFLHPDLEFKLTYPEAWNVENTKTVVYAASPDGDAALQLTGARVAAGTTPATHAREFFRRYDIDYGTGERLRVGPFTAYRAPFLTRTQTGELYGVAGFIVDDDFVYELVGLTRRNAIRRYTPVFHEVIESFDRLRDRSALEIEPRTIHLYEVPRAVAFRDALHLAGMEEEHFDELSLLNNTMLDAEVAAGETIKVVRRGAP